MKKQIAMAATGGLLGALIFSANAFAAPPKADNGMFVDANGMTLYTFDKDTAGSGKSACNGGCAANWPPFIAADSDKPAGDFSIVTRDDGKKQWAAKGWPLYYWSKDSKPGDKTGDGVGGAWKTAKP